MPNVRLLTGDCREVLKALPADSVDCVVTSPPYWGLRDYGTAQWEGGNPECAHKGSGRYYTEKTAAQSSSDAFSVAGPNNAERLKKGRWREGGQCDCGAVHRDPQMGLEPTWQEHVDGMVEVFREVRRILKPTGTLWLNYGDSYATSVNGRSAADTKATGNDDRTFRDKPFSTVQGVLKPKDLCGIPWRVAFALQADGWYLRQDIIWSKPNPMPESITDRCTKAHEYIFLLAKSRRYYFDAEAIKEENADPSESERIKQRSDRAGNGEWKPGTGGRMGSVREGRNKRSVWEVATQPFSEAHFATFPPALVEPCIKAGCPEKACAKCGAPWVWEVEKTKYKPPIVDERFVDASRGDKTRALNGSEYRKQVRVIGETWGPTCNCGVETVPGVVLDPFGGAGTTGLVADRLGRNAILIELNPDYAGIGKRRIVDDAPLFATVSAE